MELRKWQADELAQHQNTPKRAEFVDPRLGKTLLTVLQIQIWQAKLGPKFGGVVVAPLAACPWWVEELQRYGVPTLKCYSGAIAARLSAIRTSSVGQVIVVNYDALQGLVDTLLKKVKPKIVVLDESHWIKSPSAKRARASRRLAWAASYVRILTGTPVPNHYGELWGQLTCVNPESWGTSYTRFAEEFLVHDKFYPSKVIGYKQGALTEIKKRLKRDANIVKRDDVFGPDEYQYMVRDVELSHKARSLYSKLAKQWVIDEPRVSAEHVLSRMMKLRQITSGYIRDDVTKKLVWVDDSKVKAVVMDLDEIVESGFKSVVFHQFRAEGKRYVEELTRKFPQALILELNGSVSGDRRNELIGRFNATKGPVIAVVQNKVAGVSVDLSTATYAMVVSDDYSYVDRKQKLDRIYKPGTRRCVIDYRATETIDGAISNAQKHKMSIQEAVKKWGAQAVALGQ